MLSVNLAHALAGLTAMPSSATLQSVARTLLVAVPAGAPSAAACTSQGFASEATSRRASNTGASTSESTSSSSSPASGDSWRSALNTRFAIRPSFMSQLFPTYKLNQELEQRRNLLLQLLSAHSRLAREIEGLDPEQARRTARYRIAQLRSLGADARSLMDKHHAPKNLTECTDRSSMYGFFELLDVQAQLADKEAREFAALQAGRSSSSVWEYWRSHFEERYAHVPSLEPLPVIFSKASSPFAAGTGAAVGAQALGSPAVGGAAALHRRRLQPQPAHGAYLNADGIAHSEGKRKSSVARVKLGGGQGRMTVNGAPYDEYFRDVHLRAHLLQPFFLTGALGSFDVDISVRGGGPSGQAQAARTAVARALALQLGPSRSSPLRALSRWDGRRVERKKPARKKARRGFQWVKR